ncbi:6013_t:CDS:2 [Racocetra persica]|uniref:6013_t:CDS:1 n=1 Tax=Racocetra persica TaxID=160502 RepID=A0ACA9NTQ2_9GLOM|nr:6013_t:CDS:2 [Racocetra persica]
MALPVENSLFQKYGEDEIEILDNFYGQSKNISGNLIPAILNSENLNYEWLSVRFLLTNYKNLNFLEAWKHIFFDLSTFNEIYPETAKPKLENFNFQLAYQEWCKLDHRIK